MAAVASPTPFAFHAGSLETRQPLKRQSVRNVAPRSFQMRTTATELVPRHIDQQPTTTDSSDDEELAPIKLSAEAQAILGEDNSNVGFNEDISGLPSKDGLQERGEFEGFVRQVQIAKTQSPDRGNGSPAPRVVRVDTKRPSPRATLARDGSFMYKIHDRTGGPAAAHDSKTPAPQVRRIRVSGSRSQTRSPPSSSIHTHSTNSNSKSTSAHQDPDLDPHEAAGEEGYVPAGPSTIVRPRPGDENAMHSTMRVRRIGTGTLLNRPVRRGMIRRQSEEDEGELVGKEDSHSPEIEYGRRAPEPDLIDVPDDNFVSYGSPKRQAKPQNQFPEVSRRKSPTPLPVAPNEESIERQRKLFISNSSTKPTPASNDLPSSKASSSNRRPVFTIPSLPPLESQNDQENEPPPTFKRTKPAISLLEVQDDEQIRDLGKMPEQPLQPQSSAHQSPSRQALAPRSNNTPRRPAPAPPPKMSLVEAATSNAGNSRAKKSVHYILNNRTYRRLDCIGRGGSSRVFRIMAENYKIFALKRVNLEEADMAAIAGYKGEIDLLQKLSNVDRVIRLFDYEVNEEKGVLNVMMELGESDFNKMLNEQLKGENAKLDVTFTRHYWKEMLECVKAVHDHDIVHSDLKPANFLLVKGQLKLIDFGIANAIQDNTVNVHRENQIGTPNYMSPESLVCHTPASGSVTGQKILKLGKPSDVWSLGCILYQMTYGQPPFAHITKQFERIMSIPNPKVEIKFPGIGIGGAVVPFGLIKTLRRCLQRDQVLRPTIADLLSESDPFLNPVAISPDMLGRVIGNVIGYCRKREETMRQEGRLGIEGESCLPKDEEMRGWPGAFYEKLRVAGVEGSAW